MTLLYFALFFELGALSMTFSEHITNTNGLMKSNFANLLHNLANINERRVDALKKLTKLQDFIGNKGNLAAHEVVEEQHDTVEDNHYSVLDIEEDDLTLKLRRNALQKQYYNEPKSRENIEERENIYTAIDNLRRSWRDSCNRKAAKVCRDACINAYRNVCSTYSCSRRVKRSFKTECKRSCRNKFEGGKYSDYE